MSTIMEAAESLRCEVEALKQMLREEAERAVVACVLCKPDAPCGWHRPPMSWDRPSVADEMRRMGESEQSIRYWLGELPVVTPPKPLNPPSQEDGS